MKNTIKFLALACIAVSTIACNKAKFVDADILSFASNRVNVTEDAGVLKIPVLLYGADECVVTYSVTAGTAKEGEHYEIVDRQGKPNNTGVLTVSNVDKAVNDSIRIKITDLTGIETGNLTFVVTLKESAEENINLGAFSTCSCTIIDNDGGLAKLIGSWSGTGKNKNGVAISFDFFLEDYDPSSDPDAEYPEANCMLTDGNFNNDMDFAAPLYAYFDKNMSQLHVYGLQPFNAYNFTDIGPCYVAFGNASSATMYDDIILNAGDGILELQDMIYIWLLTYETGSPNGYYYNSVAAGFTWTKK